MDDVKIMNSPSDWRDSFNAKHRKSNLIADFYRALYIADDNTIRCAVDCRFFYAISNVYCCIWLFDSVNHRTYSGSSYVSGYGYHKASAALSSALDDMNIKLSHSISGVGEYAIKNVLIELGRILSRKDYIELIVCS